MTSNDVAVKSGGVAFQTRAAAAAAGNERLEEERCLDDRHRFYNNEYIDRVRVLLQKCSCIRSRGLTRTCFSSALQISRQVIAN